MIELIDPTPRPLLLEEARANLRFVNDNAGTDGSYESLARLINNRLDTKWDKSYVRRFIADKEGAGARLTAAQVKELHMLAEELKSEVEDGLIRGMPKRRLSVVFADRGRAVTLSVAMTPGVASTILDTPDLMAALKRAVEGVVDSTVNAYQLGQETAPKHKLK